jgi:hypothetical protein
MTTEFLHPTSSTPSGNRTLNYLVLHISGGGHFKGGAAVERSFHGSRARANTRSSLASQPGEPRQEPATSAIRQRLVELPTTRRTLSRGCNIIGLRVTRDLSKSARQPNAHDVNGRAELSRRDSLIVSCSGSTSLSEGSPHCEMDSTTSVRTATIACVSRRARNRRRAHGRVTVGRRGRRQRH